MFMIRHFWAVVLLGSGCFWQEQQTATVTNNPFGHLAAVPPTTQVSYSAASVKIAAQVDTLGRRIMTANPQLEQAGVNPTFRTIGAPQEEIFHRGTSEI